MNQLCRRVAVQVVDELRDLGEPRLVGPRDTLRDLGEPRLVGPRDTLRDLGEPRLVGLVIVPPDAPPGAEAA